MGQLKDLNFKKSFYTWLDQALAGPIPEKVVGFAFNLVELAAKPKFGIELVGTTRFSLDDEDWACDDIFSANPQTFPIPDSISETEWETCLQRMIGFTSEYLASGRKDAETLNSALGIGIGFVDGNLHLLKT